MLAYIQHNVDVSLVKKGIHFFIVTYIQALPFRMFYSQNFPT